MKITTFAPIIVTSHFDEVVSLFEALGFEKKACARHRLGQA